MNIGEKYNKTNIHYQICIEKADYFSPLLCFFAFRLDVTNCELAKRMGDTYWLFVSSDLLQLLRQQMVSTGRQMPVLRQD